MPRPTLTHVRSSLGPRRLTAIAKLGLVLIIGLIPCPESHSQTRPAPSFSTERTPSLSPHAVYESPAFTQAVQARTRSRNGRPGAEYWQQFASYEIDAQLDPTTHRLSGHETIVYHNHSPDTLRQVAVHLRQNLFRAPAARRESVPITGGLSLHRVTVNGQPLFRVSSDSVVGYRVEGTVAWLRLPTPVAPDGQVELAFEWSHDVPPAPADGRQGREGRVYFLGYWYPHVAVYDDVNGWVAEPYTGQAEFYMGQADYDVQLTVPDHWLVGATGVLQNPEDVLSERTQRRLERAKETGRVVSVLEDGERGSGAATRASSAPGSTATWHFRARSVRDFAWGTSDRYLWDATRALVAPSPSAEASTDDSGTEQTPLRPDTVLIHSFYRPTDAASAWREGGARYTAEAVEALSAYLDQPYPYPTMTSMEGVLQGGGMEYPMITIMQPWSDTLKLAGDLMHEVGHMWVPMEVGTNEKQFVWMDEGLTQFNTAQGMRRICGPGPRPTGRPNDSEMGQRDTYLRMARKGYEVPLMRHGDRIPASLYFDLPYDKAAQVLSALRSLVGKTAFQNAYRTFINRWWGKHPQPYDFFNTFTDVTGQDLSWFWHSWFYTTGTLDQALSSARETGDSTAVTVSNLGRLPMPTRVAVSRNDGSTEHHTVPVEVWLQGAQTYTFQVARQPHITRIVIDPQQRFPDIDRSNQIWTP